MFTTWGPCASRNIMLPSLCLYSLLFNLGGTSHAACYVKWLLSDLKGSEQKNLAEEMVNTSVICVISGFRREVDENCARLGYYAASSGNFLPKFRDNLSVPSSGVKIPKESQKGVVLIGVIFSALCLLFHCTEIACCTWCPVIRVGYSFCKELH